MTETQKSRLLRDGLIALGRKHGYSVPQLSMATGICKTRIKSILKRFDRRGASKRCEF